MPGGNWSRWRGSPPPTSRPGRRCGRRSGRSRVSRWWRRLSRCHSPGRRGHRCGAPPSPWRWRGRSRWPWSRTGGTAGWPSGRGRSRPSRPCPLESRKPRNGSRSTRDPRMSSCSTRSGTTPTSPSPSPRGFPRSNCFASAGPTTSNAASRASRPRWRSPSTRASWASRTKTASTSAASPSAGRPASSTPASIAVAAEKFVSSGTSLTLTLTTTSTLTTTEAVGRTRKLTSLPAKILDLVLAHVRLMALERRAERVRVVVARDEKEVAAIRRVQRRVESGLAGIGNGARRQSLPGIGVVWMLPPQVGLVQVPVPFEVIGKQYRINDGRVGIEPHVLLQSIVKDARDARPLLRLSCLLLHDAGQRDRLQLVELHPGKPLRLGVLPRLVEARHHRLRDAQASHRARHRIGIGKEKPLQVLAGNAQLASHRRIARQLEEIVRGTHARLADDPRDLVDAQPLRRREVVELDVAVDQFPQHLVGEQRPVELIFAGFDVRAAPEPMQVRVEAVRIGDDAGVREQPHQRVRADARWNGDGARSPPAGRGGELPLVVEGPGEDAESGQQDEGERPEDKADR